MASVPRAGSEAAPAADTGPRRRRRDPARSPWLTVVVLAVSLVLWELAARTTIPILLPGPMDVARAGWKSASDGSLFLHIGASYFRILVGWAVGCAIAIPFGIVAGRSKWVRAVLEPYIE